MRVLIISTNTLPAAPSGPAYLAGAVRQAGHPVAVYDALFAADLENELESLLDDFRPEVIAVSIRLVFGDVLDPAARYGSRHIDQRPWVKRIITTLRRFSRARILLGGPGFSYYARDWLDYLAVDEGIRGEGEESFLLYLRLLAGGGDPSQTPGWIGRSAGGWRENPPHPVEGWEDAPLPAYDLFDLPRFAARHIQPALFTKRGCAFSCSYCPYARLEGKRYRLKSTQRVLAEVAQVAPGAPDRQVIFCDNSFNIPIRHSVELCRAFAETSLDFGWGSGDIKPIGVTREYARMLEESRCFYVNLAIESASEGMLKRLKRGYSVRQVRQALDALSQTRIPFGVSLMFGGPGETPQTIAETLAVIADYQIPCDVWVTIGIYLWTDLQELAAEALASGYLKDRGDLFRGAVYFSPDLSPGYLEDLSVDLRSRPGYLVQVNKPSEEWVFPRA